MKRYVVVLAVMALLMVALAVPAFAAPRGQVERGPAHARSICSFSGLNDNPGVEGGQTQSYGQLVRHGEIEPSAKGEGPTTPGFFCNPVKGPFALK
jgi:hypothetical protein